MHFATLDGLLIHFKEGGALMWALVFWLVLVVAVFADRTRVLFRERADNAHLLFVVRALLFGGLRDRAISVCAAHASALARVTLAALLKADRPDAEVRAALQQALLHERPRLERRTAYLATLGQLASWTGLYGTLAGLLLGSYSCGYGTGGSHEGGPSIDPARKAEQLACAVSEAMNCTAGGLAVGIVAVLAFALLQGRTQTLLDELEQTAASMAHAIARSREAAPHRDTLGE